MRHDATFQNAVDRLRHDVAATVGDAHASVVQEELGRLGQLDDVTGPARLDKLIEDVQQRLHDEFTDTTWPACPYHANHPMWFRDGWWWCEKSNVRVVPLGSLTGR